MAKCEWYQIEVLYHEDRDNEWHKVAKSKTEARARIRVEELLNDDRKWSQIYDSVYRILDPTGFPIEDFE